MNSVSVFTVLKIFGSYQFLTSKEVSMMCSQALTGKKRIQIKMLKAKEDYFKRQYTSYSNAYHIKPLNQLRGGLSNVIQRRFKYY